MLLLSSERKWLFWWNIHLDHVSVIQSVCQSVSPQSVLWQNDWLHPDAIWGDKWGWLRDWCIRWGWLLSKGRETFGVKLRHPIVTSGTFAMWLFSNYFEELLIIWRWTKLQWYKQDHFCKTKMKTTSCKSKTKTARNHPRSTSRPRPRPKDNNTGRLPDVWVRGHVVQRFLCMHNVHAHRHTQQKPLLRPLKCWVVKTTAVIFLSSVHHWSRLCRCLCLCILFSVNPVFCKIVERDRHWKSWHSIWIVIVFWQSLDGTFVEVGTLWMWFSY